MRAIAGRLGYCALDRTRAVLQGDEVRACWQAPARRETFEGGLFGDIVVAPQDAEATHAHVDTRTPVDTSADPDMPMQAVTGLAQARADVAGTRSWAIPVDGRPPAGTSGLREATHVPGRGTIARTTHPVAQVRLTAADRELGHVAQLPTVREGDQDRHQPVAGDRVLDHPEA